MNKYINFLPSAAAGMSEKEWDAFCVMIDEFYRIKGIGTRDIFDVISLAIKIKEAPNEDLVREFDLYCKQKPMTLNEGLTHPNEWIRYLSRRTSAKS